MFVLPLHLRLSLKVGNLHKVKLEAASGGTSCLI